MAGSSIFEFRIDWNGPRAAQRERRVLACELEQAQAPDRVKAIDRAQFDARFAGQATEPEAGRYYPKAMIAAALGYSRRELTPFLVTRVSADRVDIDLNHPLARFDLTLSARRRELEQRPPGTCTEANALVDLLTGNGPGMQASADVAAPLWFSRYPFEREDAAPDDLFYRAPRLVPHIDASASVEVAALYARFIRPGIRVLDLMSSWMSHLPDSGAAVSVTGLGLNEQELSHNASLDERVIHDLNRSPELPFDDQSFDLVICTASVEYLTRPIEVFREVARVLKPGGTFVNTFSNRWFPPKAIVLWARVHPFERLGLVLSYYARAWAFQDLHTESFQGLPRPRGDKYYGRLAASDPVFAVWGARQGEIG